MVSRKNSRARILESALRVVSERGEAAVSMAEIAEAAAVSRQAVYLHFADRAALMIALAQYADERRGLEDEVHKIREAPTALAAVREMVALQARMNPSIWAVARAFDAIRRNDEAAERAWQDRLAYRLEGCREIVGRIKNEGKLRPCLDASDAADLLWSITSLRVWEDLVLLRGWSARQYQKRITALALASLTSLPPDA